MASIRFVGGKDRHRAGSIAEATYIDDDGVMASIELNVDETGRLFELDFWKVDFSPLRRYPRTEDLQQTKPSISFLPGGVTRAEALRQMSPHLLADVYLYPVADGGKKSTVEPGWGCLCSCSRWLMQFSTMDGLCSMRLLHPENADDWVWCSSTASTLPARILRPYFAVQGRSISGKDTSLGKPLWSLSH
jgi:hypothetical protein